MGYLALASFGFEFMSYSSYEAEIAGTPADTVALSLSLSFSLSLSLLYIYIFIILIILICVHVLYLYVCFCTRVCINVCEYDMLIGEKAFYLLIREKELFTV